MAVWNIHLLTHFMIMIRGGVLIKKREIWDIVPPPKKMSEIQFWTFENRWGGVSIFQKRLIYKLLSDPILKKKNCAERHIRPLYVNLEGDIFFVGLVPSVAQLSSAFH